MLLPMALDLMEDCLSRSLLRNSDSFACGDFSIFMKCNDSSAADSRAVLLTPATAIAATELEPLLLLLTCCAHEL